MRTIAVIPAYNSEDAIAEAIRALTADRRIEEIVVVDDSSSDATARMAAQAGARVIRLPKNSGKHCALRRAMLEATGAEVLLMVDADTGSSAKGALELLGPVYSGSADMVIGVLPAAGRHGGLGLVKRMAGWFVWKTSGFKAVAPMSGQRALRAGVFERCGLSGYGFAVDAALTADAVNAGFAVLEQPVFMTHDHRGRRISGFLHRGRQGWHVFKTFVPRLRRGRF